MDENTVKFMEKLKELLEVARKKDNVVEVSEVNDFFAGFYANAAFDTFASVLQDKFMACVNAFGILAAADAVRTGSAEFRALFEPAIMFVCATAFDTAFAFSTKCGFRHGASDFLESGFALFQTDQR